MKKLFALSLILIGGAASTFAQMNSKDQESIRDIVRTMEEGWNAKNGEKFSAGFAPVHDYIVWNGLYFNRQTKEENAQAHQRIFDSFYKTTDLKLMVENLKPIREDLVLAHVLGVAYEHNTPVPADPKVIITMLFEKKDNKWQIISFHNSDIEISFEPGTPSQGPPPQAMYKNWYASR